MRLIDMSAPLRMGVSLVIYVLGMMLAIRGRADDGDLPSGVYVQSNTSSMIAKTVVSSRVRIVVVVGLESTGQQFFVEVFKTLFNHHKNLAVISPCFVARGILLDRTLSVSFSNYVALKESMRSGMKTLAEREENLEAPGTIVPIQGQTAKKGLKCSPLGEMSFPNGHGPDKVLKYPDIKQVAQLAEEEGVDLRIIYLQRSAESMLVSSVVHRELHNQLSGVHAVDSRDPDARFMAYVQTVLADAGVMHSMLSELGPGFVICHHYDEMANETQAGEIADFLAPSEVVAKYIKNSMLMSAHKRKSSDEGLRIPEASILTERIQRKLDVIEEQQCGDQALWKR